MGTTFRFIAEPSESSEVMTWFKDLEQPPQIVQTKHHVVLYFSEIGPLVYDSTGAVDSRSSPVVTIFLPRVRRGVLWTVGEVHFLATPLRKKFPALHKLSSRFSK